jgi:hypothetical protein
MRCRRNIIAITLVAAALCADRAVVAAPILRPQMTNVASRLVSRLSARFQRVTPAILIYQNQNDAIVSAEKHVLISDTTACFGTRLSPLLLRLPPPGV